MKKRLLSYDSFNGLSKIFHPSDDDTFVIETEMAAPIVEEIFESNKAKFNDAPSGWGNGSVVASIPIHIYWDLKKRGIADDDAAMKRWLNDSDNRYFRTRPGTV